MTHADAHNKPDTVLLHNTTGQGNAGWSGSVHARSHCERGCDELMSCQIDMLQHGNKT
jgi:hypothetical protein